VTTRQPRAAEAEHGDRLARKGSDGDHDFLTVIPETAQRLSGISRFSDAQLRIPVRALHAPERQR
jgi:hypothetical protein